MTKKYYSVTRLDEFGSNFGVITDAYSPELGNYYDIVAKDFTTEEQAQAHADELNGGIYNDKD